MLTRAAFSKLGDYTLKLTAGEDDLTSADTLNVRVEPAASAAHLEPVYTTKYKISSPLWKGRDKALIVNWIPHCYTMIDDLNLREGGIGNLIEAGKKLRGEPAKSHVGYPFSNAWVYNTLESMCLAQMVDPRRRRGNCRMPRRKCGPKSTNGFRLSWRLKNPTVICKPDSHLARRDRSAIRTDPGHWDPHAAAANTKATWPAISWRPPFRTTT